MRTLEEIRSECRIYIDVSGGINNSIDSMLEAAKALLPTADVYDFDCEVRPHTQDYTVSAGTMIDKVYEDIFLNNIKKAVIITDGYIDWGALFPESCSLHFLIHPNGLDVSGPLGPNHWSKVKVEVFGKKGGQDAQLPDHVNH